MKVTRATSSRRQIDTLLVAVARQPILVSAVAAVLLLGLANWGPTSTFSTSSLDSPLFGEQHVFDGIQAHKCKTNAIIYMAQKKHTSYDRDSYGLLLKSLDLLHTNYLMINNHYQNTTVFIFHTGDFDSDDLRIMESRYERKYRGVIQLVNLLGTSYWQIPEWLAGDDPATWLYPQFTVGYRHMIRWYAIKMWHFFRELNTQLGCNYRFIMRMDEESFLHSPIEYDLFGFMSQNNYQYAYRLCSYEMADMRNIMNNYTHLMRYNRTKGGKRWREKRGFNKASCGFYNNWFIGELELFMQDDVQHFLNWIDRESYMYRRRTNDLVIQTATVLTFVDQTRIHRFLDWTYEHFTMDKTTNCPQWGALQLGYEDQTPQKTLKAFMTEFVTARNCSLETPGYYTLKLAELNVKDLSPTYNHIPMERQHLNISMIKAGKVDRQNEGTNSG
jgi:hypothetical protein